ncbi:MAG: GrpB family protein [Methanobacteriota archaeon]|nr:MAG: GrpB family protein [Euryarchaeota archaeon]
MRDRIVNVPHDGDGKRLLIKKGPLRKYRVHVVRRASWTYWKNLVSRGSLIASRELSDECERPKFELADRYRNDREVYPNAKTRFIERAVSERV